MYNSYIELLKSVKEDGETISSSSVSANRSFATKELNNVQVKMQEDIEYILNENEKKYLKIEMDWFMDRIMYVKKIPLELTHEPEDMSKHAIDSSIITVENVHKKLKEMSFSLLDGCINRAGPNSNYGEMCLRLKNHIGITQVEWVCNKLEKDPSSRQAVAFYNSPSYQYWSNQDFVCTLNQLFSIKNNSLNTVVNIRSNDLINCFRFDSIWYRTFQKIVLSRLQKVYPKLKLGYLLCNIFSAHYYIKDQDKLEEIIVPGKKFLSLDYII